MGKRILIISAQGLPHPSAGASVVIFHNYIEGLLRANFKVFHVHICLDTEEYSQVMIEEYQKGISEFGTITVHPVFCPNPVKRSIGGFYFDHSLLAGVLGKAKAFQADIFLGLDFMSYWAAQSLSFPFRMVWLGDLKFQTLWYHALSQAREESLKALRVPSAWKHCYYWKKTYKKVLKSADKVIVSSGSSVSQIRKLGIESSYHPFPWPHSPILSDVAVSALRSTKPAFLFCGGLNALGSKSALLFILDKLHAQLLRIWGSDGFRIIITGRGNPSAWARNAMGECGEVDFRGFVEDLDAVMAECHGLIVPIDVPVGNRCRIVSALAKGWLVIAHKFTQAGNPDLRDGENCYLAEDAHDFSVRMRMAYENPEASDQIRENATVCYRRNFLPERSVSRMIEAFPS